MNNIIWTPTVIYCITLLQQAWKSLLIRSIAFNAKAHSTNYENPIQAHYLITTKLVWSNILSENPHVWIKKIIYLNNNPRRSRNHTSPMYNFWENCAMVETFYSHFAYISPCAHLPQASIKRTITMQSSQHWNIQSNAFQKSICSN